MKTKLELVFLLIIMVCFAILFFYYTDNNITNKYHVGKNKHKSTERVQQTMSRNSTLKNFDTIVISFVVCNNRLKEALNVVKSVLIFTKRSLKFVIFCDNEIKFRLSEALIKWETLTKHQFVFEMRDIVLPKANHTYWLYLFRKCAAQRLFFPTLLNHLDALIYVDVDTVFLGPVEELWQKFSQFKGEQISALALEHENPHVSSYQGVVKHPYYGKHGLNSGVMLMNLTRMRDFHWVKYIKPVMRKWKDEIRFGDQDIINIIFYFHPKAVYILSCRYNYRVDHCEFFDICAPANTRGVYLLHGNRWNFYTHGVLMAVVRVIAEYQVGTEPTEELLLNMNKYILKTPSSNCRRIKDVFLKVPANTIKTLQK